MTQATTVDFAAVGRVSSRSELKDIRLTDVSAKCEPKSVGPLESEFSHDCTVAGRDNESLDVRCAYRFIGRNAGVEVINISITYLVVYALKTTEPLAEGDISQFAVANGTLHSWPFVREFLHGLTSRMGFPPFKLGVMHFVPLQPAQPPAQKEAPKAEQPIPQGQQVK